MGNFDDFLKRNNLTLKKPAIPDSPNQAQSQNSAKPSGGIGDFLQRNAQAIKDATTQALSGQNQSPNNSPEPAGGFDRFLQRNGLTAKTTANISHIAPSSEGTPSILRQILHPEEFRPKQPTFVSHPISHITDPAKRQEAINLYNKYDPSGAMSQQQDIDYINAELIQPMQELAELLSDVNALTTEDEYDSYRSKVDELLRSAAVKKTTPVSVGIRFQLDQIMGELKNLKAAAEIRTAPIVQRSKQKEAYIYSVQEAQRQLDNAKALKQEYADLHERITISPSNETADEFDRIEYINQTYGDLDDLITQRETELEEAMKSQELFDISSVVYEPDFEDKSKYASTSNGKKRKSTSMIDANGQEVGIVYSETGFNDITYDYINGNTDAIAIIDDIYDNIGPAGSIAGINQEYLMQLEDAEIKIFNYLYSEKGPNVAYHFIDLLKDDLYARQRIATEANAAAAAREHPILSSLGTVVMSPLKSVGYVAQAADYLDDGKLQANASYNQISYASNATRNEVSKMIESSGKWGAVGSLAYQTGMSMGDFLMSTAVSGGNQALALGIMGTGAAADATIEAKDRGLSDKQAFALGTIAGATEIVLERLPLEALLGTPKGKVSYLLKNALSEAGEEAGSNIVNTLADIIVSQDQSKWQMSMNAYLDSGKAKNENEAFWMAMRDKAVEIGIDALAGGLSGGAMGSIGLVGHSIKVESSIRKLDADSIAAIINEGLSCDKDTDSYRIASQLEAKVYNDELITKKDLRSLLRANNAAIGQQHQAVLDAVSEAEGTESRAVDSTADIGTENVPSQISSALSNAVLAVQQGGTVSNSMAESILADAQTVEHLTQKTGMVLPETQSGRRAAVKDSVAQLAQRTASDADAGVSYDNVNTEVQAISSPEENRYESSNGGITNVQSGYEGAGDARVLSGGQGRGLGSGTGGPAGGMARSAGSTQAESEQRATASSRQSTVNAQGIKAVSSAALGVQNGSTKETLRVMPEELWDDAQKATAERIYEKTGKRTTFVIGALLVDTPKGAILANGVWTARGIIIQADHRRFSIDQIADHEIFHDMSFRTPWLVRQIEDTIRQKFVGGELDQVIAAYTKKLALLPENATPKQIEDATRLVLDEIMADAYAGVNRFSADAAQFHADVVQQVAENVQPLEHSQENGVRETNAPPVERYSIDEINGENGEYGVGVHLDTDIFDGVKPSAWGRVLSNFVYNHLAGTEMTIYDENGASETICLANMSDRVRKDGANNSHKVIDKLARYRGDNIKALSTVHLSELLTTSKRETSTSEHSHQWMDENGWEYRKAYIQDRNGKIYEATLNIANGRDRRILYDINNIRQIDKERTARGVVPSTNEGRGSHTKDSSSAHMVSDDFDVVKGKFMEDDSDTDVPTENNRQQVQNSQNDSKYRYLSESPKSLAKKRETRYNKSKQFFPGNVFPPYKESQSDSHEIAERWAKSDSAKVQRKKLISHHGQWYLIESFDDMDYGYQIVRKIDYRNYEKEARFYGTITGFESVQNTSGENASLLREGAPDGGERNRSDTYDSEYGTEDTSIRSVGGEQVQRGEVPSEQRPTDWSRSEDWGESDESPVNTFSDNANRFMEDDSTLPENDHQQLKNLQNVPEYRPGMKEDNRSQAKTPDDVFIADVEKRAIKAKADLMRNIPKEDFQGTDALDKLGIKVENSVGNYSMVKSMIANDHSAKEIIREMRKAEKRLNATAGEKNYADGIAAGYYQAANIPSDMDADKVLELADYLWAVKAISSDLINKRRADIKGVLYRKMERIMQRVDTSKIKLPKAFALHHRSAVRNMTTIFGPEIGKQLNDFLFHPVATNEAERQRFVNRMHDAVRKFEGKDGTRKKLTKRERALVQMVIEGRAVEETVSGLEMRHAIKNAAHNIRNGSDAGDAAREFSLNYEERKLAIQYSRWMQTLEALEDDRVDAVRIDNAVKKYSEQFDLFHEAINDFLVAHGYEPIGYIKGYAPHMQPKETQSALSKALEMLGIPPDVSTLPTSIAGLTKDYKPNKRWNPFFLSRRGDVTNYDIATAYESYVDYMSDVIYHTDDIMRVRQATEWFRKTYAPEHNREIIDQALELRYSSFDEKLAFLRENDQISLFSVPSEANINDALDEYIEKLFGNLGDKTIYSDFVMWLDDYANKLAGKQLMADRNQEKSLGRTSLNFIGKLRRWFTRAQVAGNIASALNNTAQLPQIIGENGLGYTVLALKDMTTFRLRRTGWHQDSDFLTEKKGIRYIVNSPGEMIVRGTFKLAEFWDGSISTLAVRGRYLKEIKAGKSHAEAMKIADRFGRSVMGSRAKGSVPLAFQEKGIISQFFHTFQVEAANSWEHLVVDLPQDFRQIQQQHGVRAAAGALAGVIIKTLISAFLLNRFSEELYGGTPAPYDLLGLTANFIASGHELSTNEFLLTVMDNCWESVTGERIFDTEDNGNLSDGEFDWGAAVSDSGYNISNDIPYLRNAFALLGWGDDTLPIPDLWGTGKDIYNALTDENAGLFSYEMGQALLGLAGDVLPGGRQLEKTVAGIETAIRGGKYKGRGDNAKLQYPVDVDLGTAIRLALFGDAAASERQEFYASGDSALTAGQTKTYEELVRGGVSPEAVYDAIQEYRHVDNDDSLSSVDRSKKGRDIIRNMDMSDDLKLEMYRGLTGAESVSDQFRIFMDEGLGWDKIMDTYDTYGAPKFSDRQIETYQTLTGGGANPGEVYEAIHEYRQVSNDDTLSGVDRGKKGRDIIRNMDMSDDLKLEMYRGLVNAESTVEKFRLFMDEGLNWDEITDVYNRYAALRADEELDETAKATQFARWVDGQGFSTEQEDVVKDQLLFWNMYPARAAEYEEFVDSGLDEDDAYELTEDLSELEPVGDADQVTDLQKWRTCVDFSSNEHIQMSALAAKMDETQFVKVQIAYDNYISPDTYITFREVLAHVTGGGSPTNEEAKIACNRMRGLEPEDRAVLWQLAVGSKSAKNNPFSIEVGEKVLKAKQEAEDADKES